MDKILFYSMSFYSYVDYDIEFYWRLSQLKDCLCIKQPNRTGLLAANILNPSHLLTMFQKSYNYPVLS